MEPTSKSEWPAFPAMHYDLAEHEHGMTLRDYFAAKAMQAILGDPDYSNPDDKLAAASYSIADAMMEARNAAQ
jgi:hypothetical protein